MIKLKQIIWIFLLFASISANATTRVPEVEAQIRDNVSHFLTRLYPNSTYTLEITVTPRRADVRRNNQQEDLPFFNFEQAEQLDPWENPDINIYALYSRIDRVKIVINFQGNLKLSNRESFVSKLLKDINLVPGRDSVEVNINETPFLQKNWESIFDNQYYLTTFVLAMVVLISGLLIVGVLNKKLNLNQILSSANNNKNSEAEPTPAPQMPYPLAMSNNSNNEKESNSQGSISLTDPTKSLELAREKIQEIVSSKTFPNLIDMITMEKLLLSDPKAFAQLVYEFPIDAQDRIFALGKGEKWYQGFCEVGQLTPSVIFTLDIMLRNRRYKFDQPFEELLIQCWRMGDQCEDFLKTSDKTDVLSLLSFLPKNISIPLARRVLPGAWGAILSGNGMQPVKDPKKVQELMKKALVHTPYLEKKSLDLYLNRRDLLDYLGVCEVNEEQEIYMISENSSELEVVRPPFFHFFELEKEKMQKIYTTFSLDQWALILFNAPREYRVKLDGILSDKEKYLISNYMKNLDLIKPDYKLRGKLRKRIGKLVFEAKRRQNTETVSKTNNQSQNSEGELNGKAA